MLKNKKISSMRRCSRLSVVVSIGSENSACMKSSKSLLKGTLIMLSSIPFVFCKSDAVISDI